MNQFTGIKENLMKVRDLFKALLDILEAEGDFEINYARNELGTNIILIDAALNDDAADLTETFAEIKRSYQSMYPSHGGLTDFFIWRDDFAQRQKANQPLDKIKEELNAILTIN